MTTEACPCWDLKDVVPHSGYEHCCFIDDTNRPFGEPPACGHADSRYDTWKWMMIRDCPEEHSAYVNRVWQPGPNAQLGIVLQRNGTPGFKLRCPRCDKTTPNLPKSKADELALSGRRIEWIENNISTERCVVRACVNPGIELHHFAPRNTFDHDAEKWPILPLCRAHHIEWHTRMDGYRWHSARRSA